MAPMRRELIIDIALLTACSVEGATLFFSQFQEASSGNNKYFEIYNPTSASIDLAVSPTPARACV